MLKITGYVLLFVGVAAGAVLVAAPFGLSALPGPPSLTAWVLFPAGFAAGPLLIALGASSGSLAGVLRLCAGLLLGLAVAAMLGLVLLMLGILHPDGSTLSLWYVLALAGALGTACALAPSGLATSGAATT